MKLKKFSIFFDVHLRPPTLKKIPPPLAAAEKVELLNRYSEWSS